jgi:signal transduction histidine kinase
MELRPEPFLLAALVNEVRDILRGLAASKRIQLVVQVDPELGIVTLDPARLKQVLYNYVSNAIKFTLDGGTVSIRSTPEGATQFRLEVEDTGIGISADNLKRLFVEFQQLDASSAKRYPGTGLGLALTRRVVEALGGHVEVRSELKVGSTFAAVFPRHFLEDVATGEQTHGP